SGLGRPYSSTPRWTSPTWRTRMGSFVSVIGEIDVAARHRGGAALLQRVVSHALPELLVVVPGLHDHGHRYRVPEKQRLLARVQAGQHAAEPAAAAGARKDGFDVMLVVQQTADLGPELRK